MAYLQGIIKNITFVNEENAFAILKVEVTESSFKPNLFDPEGDVWAVKGYLPHPKKGEHIRFFGQVEHHNQYGDQFSFERYEKIEGTNKAGLIDYLSSDLFSGIGPKTAEKIVAALGSDAIEKITHDASVLDDIKGLSKKHKNTLLTGLKEHKASEQTLIKLYGFGFSPKIANRILDAYGEDAVSIITKNPYQMIEDVDGIGFERADTMAQELGFLPNDQRRIQAVIIYLLETMAYQDGHTYQEITQFMGKALEYLNKKEALVQESEVKKVIDQLVDQDKLMKTEKRLSLKSFYEQEKTLAEQIRTRSKAASIIDQTKVQKLIQAFEKAEDIVYTAQQRDAILSTLTHKLTILTGGPGTGKTTVIKGLISCMKRTYQTKDHHIHLMAPTGRAAKRLSEATNHNASTIHKALGLGFDGFFAHGMHHPMEGDLFVIDEASMIDLPLATHLFQSLPPQCHIVLVGDDNQLPSVGPGQVLKDIIDANCVHTNKLTKVHRQAEKSTIIQLAHQIKNGQLPKHLLTPKPDCYIIKEVETRFKDRLKRMVDYMLKQEYDLQEDIQVLIPMYKGLVGIDEINDFMQATYNQNPSKTITYGNQTFSLHDKVLQLQNRSEDGIMNGDQGRIIGIDEQEETLHVDFMGKEISYKKKELDQLRLAYAISVHKAQGSEYPVVIVPIFKRFTILLKRRLIYTAITRAKETLVVAGDIDTLLTAAIEIETDRKTGLMELLSQSQKNRAEAIDDVLTSFEDDQADETIMDPQIPFKTLGEDLKGKTPYDFMEDSD